MPYPNTVDIGGVIPWYLAFEGNDYTNSFTGTVTALTNYLVGVTLPTYATLINMRTLVLSGGAGHIDMGVFDTSFNLLGHTGSTTTVSGLMDLALTAQLPLSPGRYFLGMWVDNATDTIHRAAPTTSVKSYGYFLSSGNTTAGGLGANAAALGTMATSIYIPNLLATLSGGAP